MIMSLTNKKVKQLAAALGISDTGICSAARDDSLLARLLDTNTPFVGDAQNRIAPTQMLSDAQSVIVCAFSYANPAPEKVNLSRYVWVKDYHTVVKSYLERLLTTLQAADASVQGYIFTDNSPLCDKALAYRAGLGYFGKNSLLIHPRLGSFFFIGGIVTDVKLEADSPLTDTCGSCTACEKACPAQICGTGKLDGYKCISYLQQKKGALTETEEELIAKSGSAWGCDICQNICPKNQNLPQTTIPEFTKTDGFLPPQLSEEEFRANYKDRAFHWRGYKTMQRNLALLDETGKE